jgi:hypothetical protein
VIVSAVDEPTIAIAGPPLFPDTTLPVSAEPPTFWSWIPPFVLGTAAVPSAFVPTRFPRMVTACAF